MKKSRDFVLNYACFVQALSADALRDEVDALIREMSPRNPLSKNIFLKGQILLSEMETRYNCPQYQENPISLMIAEFRNQLDRLQGL